jgi:quinol---cytochrome c reductase iron-sulfur subunit, bacillus type
MTTSTDISRRKLLVKIGLLFNGIIGVILAIPVVRYLLSPVVRAQDLGSEAWLRLGTLEQFPVSQTRLAVYRNPAAAAWDGQTADIPCWVRNVDGQSFQIFAINCAHLGCPVRWFPQSNLFMCPCHGGVYYADGSLAAGPPPRGLFKYSYKLEDGQLFIKAGEMPTTGSPTASTDNKRMPCA